MSTTYAIFRKSLTHLVEAPDGMVENLEDFEEDLDYTAIGGTNYVYDSMIPLVSHMPDDTPVFATDNNTKIKTLKDLREHYEAD